MNNGLFFLSLDFEGMWGAIGGLDNVAIDAFKKRVGQNDIIIPKLLTLFEKYGIHATWAIVGCMLCNSKEEVSEMLTNDIYYPKWNLSIKEFIRRINNNSLYFFPDLIKKVAKSANQEIGSHTFSHYYANEIGANDMLFEQELRLSSQKHCEVLGQTPQTLIMPRNQVEGVNIQLLNKYGIKVVRGRADYNNWGYGIFRKMINFTDSYIPIINRTYNKPETDSIPVNLKASLFFRTYYDKLSFIEPLKIKRIKYEMTRAARGGYCFHLWFHPHNIGTNVTYNIESLEEILKHYQILNQKYGFESLAMGEYVENEVGK